MTEELFKQEPYRAQSTARVVSNDARGIGLDRTIFYPRGGGQAGDAGSLVRGDGCRIAIADTVKGETPGGILPGAAPGPEARPAALPPGHEMPLRLGRARRPRRMRLPTATQLLAGIA